MAIGTSFTSTMTNSDIEGRHYLPVVPTLNTTIYLKEWEI
jgi:hypothetical protein